MSRTAISWFFVSVAVFGVAAVERCSAQATLSLNGPGAIEAEARILRALDEPLSLDAVEMPLKDVVDRLQTDFRISIQLDLKAITDAGGTSDMPITGKFANVRLRSALDLMLAEHELNWIIQHDSLFITSDAKAKERVETRIYPVRDLVEGRSEMGDGDDYDSLLDLLTSTIAPTTWTDSGGTGSLSPFPNSKALVVSHTREIHEQIEVLLARLREIREQQGISIADDKSERRLEASDKPTGPIGADDDRAPPRRVHASTAHPAWRIPQVYR
jgi:hypothetical protein